MAHLARPDQTGFAPTHLWLAERLLAASRPAGAEQHLRRALEQQPDDFLANARLGQLYFTANRLALAEAPLQKAAPAAPALHLDLARLYAARDDKALARTHAEKALRHFQQQANANLDNHAARLQWHETALFLGDFPGAVRILEEGLRLTNHAGYRPALSRALVLYADAIAQSPSAQDRKNHKDDKERRVDEATKLRARINLLVNAVKYDYGNLAALTRLLELTRSANAGEAERARVVLHDQLAAGKDAAAIHLLLGVDAQRRQETVEARDHFEQAYRLAPDMPILINNLAWTLAIRCEACAARSPGVDGGRAEAPAGRCTFPRNARPGAGQAGQAPGGVAGFGGGPDRHQRQRRAPPGPGGNLPRVGGRRSRRRASPPRPGRQQP